MRRFLPYVLFKAAFNALVLNYAAAAFLVSEPGRGAVRCCGVPCCRGQWTEGGIRRACQSPPAPLSLPPTQVLWLHDSLAVWRSVHYLVHTSLLAIIACGALFPPRRLRADVKPEAQATAGAAGAAAAAAVDGQQEQGDGKKEL